jgi:hypothetical protein
MFLSPFQMYSFKLRIYTRNSCYNFVYFNRHFSIHETGIQKYMNIKVIFVIYQTFLYSAFFNKSISTDVLHKISMTFDLFYIWRLYHQIWISGAK